MFKRVDNNRGNAYLMVLIISMLILMTVSIALTITITSRRVTARYSYFAGLYDIAVAGKEEVLFVLRRGVQRHQYSLLPQVSAHNTEESSAFLTAQLDTYFTPTLNAHQHNWEVTILFTLENGITILDRFQGSTTIRRGGQEFFLHTIVYKYTNNIRGYPTEAEATIIWQMCENNIDYYTLEMVELKRIAGLEAS